RRRRRDPGAANRAPGHGQHRRRGRGNDRAAPRPIASRSARSVEPVTGKSALDAADRYIWLHRTVAPPPVARATLSPDADDLACLDRAVADAPVDRLDLQLALAAVGDERVEAPAL